MRNGLLIPPFLLALLLGAASATAGDGAVQSERIEVGQEAPDVALQGIDGEDYSSSALEGEQPLVLVFFRGSW